MINHFINAGRIEAGGAQKIMHQLCDYNYGSRIFSFDYKKDSDGREVGYGLIRCYAKFLFMFFFQRRKILVIHHRAFLIPLIIFKRKNLYFVCHNIFPDKNKIFDYVKSGHFVAVSEAVELYLKSFRGGYTVTLIENGISYDSDAMNLPSMDSTVRFAFVGRMSVQKGVDILIKAYIDFHKNAPNSELILIGDGESIAEYKAMASSTPSIIFKGYSETPFRICRHADAIVVPSRYEGFGLVYYEALEYGHTVIASDLEVFKRVAVDERNISFEMGDHIDLKDKLMSVSQDLDSLGRINVRHTIKSLDEMADTYIKLFKGEG